MTASMMPSSQGTSGLSPQLVRQIRDGGQPVGVTVKTLTREHDLPLLWQEQEALVTSFR